MRIAQRPMWAAKRATALTMMVNNSDRQLYKIQKQEYGMENCIAPPPPLRAAKAAPITKLRINYPWFYLRKSLLEKNQRRRDFLRFWQRARQRHIVARWQWREKLNRGLRPGIKL